MYEAYKNAITSDQCISSRSFYRICNVLTHGEVQARKAVDYVTGVLINDNFDLLTRILVDLLPEESASLIAKLHVLKAWLKYGAFEEAAFLDQQCSPMLCPRHNLKFGLEKDSNNDRTITYGPCLEMHKLLLYIRQRLEDTQTEPQTIAVVQDCYHKFDLFLGHRLRVANQQQAIAQLFREMKERCISAGGSNEALIVIDFKMKMEPIYYREKTVDHYGKRGMSWHGAMTRFWSLKESDDGDDPEPFETKVYFDHIMCADNKQDKYAVVALVEAMILSIKHDLPHITDIAEQSDNASCYQNMLVTLILPLLGAANGIKVSRYIHTETQDGKSVLDAHFARGTQKTHSWVKQGNNAATPKQLVDALTSDGGVPNSAAHLVDFNRELVVSTCGKFSKVESTFTRIIGRANDVFYVFPRIEDESTLVDNIPAYCVRAFHYSRMEPCFKVKVNIAEGTCIRMVETDLNSPLVCDSHVIEKSHVVPDIDDNVEDAVDDLVDVRDNLENNDVEALDVINDETVDDEFHLDVDEE